MSNESNEQLQKAIEEVQDKIDASQKRINSLYERMGNSDEPWDFREAIRDEENYCIGLEDGLNRLEMKLAGFPEYIADHQLANSFLTLHGEAIFR